MPNVSENFSLHELTRTETGIENDCPMQFAGNMVRLCNYLLEPARDLCGPLRINSGYRCEEVNKAVGGASSSAHLEARAADVVPLRVSPAVLFDIVRASGWLFDQVILEDGWVHMAIARQGVEPRRQALKARRGADGHMLYEHV